MSSFKYVLLGGGNAAGYAAREFVAQGVQPGELLIITEEPHVSYERPALSKAYLNPTGAPRLPGFHCCVGGGGSRQEPAWYAEHGIEYRTSCKVVSADVAAKTLTTAAGDVISYGKLIVATGCRPVKLTEFNVPGADLQGLHYLRDVTDADGLLAALEGAKAKGGKVVIVGGGYIGMEVAAGLAGHPGLQVTMVFPEPHLMARLFTAQLAAFYEQFYASKGIAIRKGLTAKAFLGEGGQVTSVQLSDGSRLAADLVVVGAGARPNAELFQGQLEVAQGGLLVDGHMRSSDEDVYAVGDVATFPLKMYGGKLARQEHVTHCRQSASHAVKAIYGASEEYDYLPFFYSREFSLSWQFYGSSEGSAVHFGDQASGKFGAYWVQGGRLVGAFLESGSPEENSALKKLAAERPAAPEAEQLAAAGIGFAVSRL